MIQHEQPSLVAYCRHVPVSISAQVEALNSSETLDMIASARARSGHGGKKKTCPSKPKAPKKMRADRFDDLMIAAMRHRARPMTAVDVWREIPISTRPSNAGIIRDRLADMVKLRLIAGRKIPSRSGPMWMFCVLEDRNNG